MGIPKFFGWLMSQYPGIKTGVSERGQTIPCDNLYIDMNGIVHGCTHPEDKPMPVNEHYAILDIFNYVEKLVKVVRPEKLLFIAIDGVPPRAKINEQRARRFKSAAMARRREDRQSEEVAQWEAQGDFRFGANKRSKPWDSNSITPGTAFMELLSASLQYWIVHKLNSDATWKKLQIIFSDANVPGEGEHKIMNFIRHQRDSLAKNLHPRHVIFGADSDLIILALATHERNFRVLRQGFSRSPRWCWELVNVTALRQQLTDQLRGQFSTASFRVEPERAIDDWICLLCFMGNDFLPALPGLNLRGREGFDVIIRVWRQALPSGYLRRDNGSLNAAQMQIILAALGREEEDFFQERRRSLQQLGGPARQPHLPGITVEAGVSFRSLSNPIVPGAPTSGYACDPYSPPTSLSPRSGVPSWRQGGAQELAASAVSSRKPLHTRVAIDDSYISQNMQAMRIAPWPASKAPQSMMGRTGQAAAMSLPAQSLSDVISGNDRRTAVLKEARGTTEDTVSDTIMWGTEGDRERYYKKHFRDSCDNVELRTQLSRTYLQGLAWVMQYYYCGIPSWDWYYPHSSAPFAADFEKVDWIDDKFTLGSPMQPLEQLMCVLPAESRDLVPARFRTLLLDHNDSGATGKISLIDERKLLEAMKPLWIHLSQGERKRNETRHPLLYVSIEHDLHRYIRDKLSNPTCQPVQLPVLRSLWSSITISGSLLHDPAYKNDLSVQCPLTNVKTYQPSLPEWVSRRRVPSALYISGPTPGRS